MMNDVEVHLPSYKEQKAPPVSLKPGSSKHKLRQLINKPSITTVHNGSPNQTQQHLSKHGIEAETSSPLCSRISDSSHVISTKAKNNLSPKLKSKLNTKTSSVKSPSFSMHSELDSGKLKDAAKKTKTKTGSYLGNLSDANSPQTMANGLLFSDLNGSQSTKENNSIAQNYMNFLASQSKNRQHDGNKLGRKNNFTENDHDDEGLNLSLEFKTKPHQYSMINAKNLSHDSQIVNSSLKHDIKEQNPTKGSIEMLNHKKSKSKVTQNGVLAESKKKLDNLKANFMKSVKNQTIDKKVGKKNNLKTNNATFYNLEKTTLGLQEKLQNEKRRALTPDDLTSKETDRHIQMEPKADKEDLKFSAIYNELLARKGSVQAQKDANLGSKKRPTSSNKEPKSKVSPKFFKKEKKTSQESPVELKLAKAKSSNISEHMMIPRTIKGSSPQIFGDTMANIGGGSSKKNIRRGLGIQESLYRDQEKNAISSNEVTLCGTQDTTVNIKGQNKKDVTVEEYDDSTDKVKRVLRTKSHAGALIGQILEDLNRGEKHSKNDVEIKRKELRSEKQSILNKKSLEIFKSMDYKDRNKNLLEREEISKSELNHNVLSLESENTLELRGLEEPQATDQVAMLSHLLERSHKLLNTYKDREATWQLERENLLTKINRLEAKEDKH